MNDARNMHWTGGAGDCFMVYPGANSSIRFEKLREGIVDYEKIRIIRIKASHSADVIVKKLMQQLEQNLQTFNIEKEFKEDKLRSNIRQGLQLINTLSERLP